MTIEQGSAEAVVEILSSLFNRSGEEAKSNPKAPLHECPATCSLVTLAITLKGVGHLDWLVRLAAQGDELFPGLVEATSMMKETGFIPDSRAETD